MSPQECTMSPKAWEAALAPDQHWTVAYPLVERAVRSFLAEQWANLTTDDLVQHLYPVSQVRGEAAMAARQRLYRALMTLAKHGLADCASTYKKPGARLIKQGWIWHTSSTPSAHKVERSLSLTREQYAAMLHHLRGAQDILVVEGRTALIHWGEKAKYN